VGQLKLRKVMPSVLDAPEPVVWSLALDEIEATGMDLRPQLPFAGPRDFTVPSAYRLAQPHLHSPRYWSRLRWTR